MTRDLADAGLRTLSYAAVFGQGLTFGQLSRFLISSDRHTTGSVIELWENWRKQGIIKNASLSAQNPHWQKALAIRSIARHIPWVQSIWVTGSLAAGTAHVDDDIDFLVITDSNRLWLSRFFLVGLSVLFGRARTKRMSQNHVKDLWCFNMWLEPDRMALPPQQQSLYTAREVVQAVPLYVRPGVSAHDFLQKNVWVQKYFARGWKIAYQKAHDSSDVTLPQEEPFQDRPSRLEGWAEPFRQSFFDTLNDFAWKWQKRRMDKGKTTEVVAKNQAFFHPRDTRSSVKAEYERICTLLHLKPYA